MIEIIVIETIHDGSMIAASYVVANEMWEFENNTLMVQEYDACAKGMILGFTILPVLDHMLDSENYPKQWIEVTP